MSSLRKDRALIKGYGFHFEGEGRVAMTVVWLGAVATILGRLILLAATIGGLGTVAHLATQALSFG